MATSPAAPAAAAGLPDYAELQCHSHFSFLRGASAPALLVERAHYLGYRALAITDECSLAGVVQAHVAARELGLKLLVGSQMTVTPERDGAPFRLIILAMNRNGYGTLSELITVGRMRADKGHYLVHPRDIAAPVGELVHLRGLPDCQLILAPDYNADESELARQAAWLVQCAPGRARIALTLHHATATPPTARWCSASPTISACRLSPQAMSPCTCARTNRSTTP